MSSDRYASANLCDYYAGGWLANDGTTMSSEILGGSRHRDSAGPVTVEPLLLRDRTRVLSICFADFDFAVIEIFVSIVTEKYRLDIQNFSRFFFFLEMVACR